MRHSFELDIRSAKPEDARFATDLMTELYPDDPQDPVQWEHFWRNPSAKMAVRRWIGELEGRPVAFAFQRHALWEDDPKRFGTVGGDLLRAHRTAERVDALLAAMESGSRADGARIFLSWTWETDALKLGVLEGRGYKEERRERFWELDLVANRERLEKMTRESRERMEREGVEVTTIDRIDDPDKWHKLHRMSNEAAHDVPSTAPYVDTPFDDFMKEMRSPGLAEDRTWVARDGEQLVGISMLSYPPSRGVVVTAWTGMARAARGRGIARAMKCETVMQAIALGVDKVRTDNDSTNAPILHINETMGYQRRPDMVQLMKEA